MTRTTTICLAFCAVLGQVASGAGAAVGSAIEVAPRVAQTRSQMWPRAAWSEGAKCWLVAWREGNTNELATDIWCARVSADGKALDPEGIKVCAADDNQERPWVASDGKDFLLVWEDFRNGKDYDVYAARVSAEGKVLDPGGFLVAGGDHNQCHPVVTFAGGNYYVAWQGFESAGGRYLLYGARVSSDGKMLDAKGVVISPSGGVLDDKASAYNPVIAAAGNRILVGHLLAAGGTGMACHAGVVSVNAQTGLPDGKPQVLGAAEQRLPALAYGAAGGLFAAPLGLSTRSTGLRLYALDDSGAGTGAAATISGSTRSGLAPLFTLALDGQRYLLTVDRPVAAKSGQQIKVFGLFMPADGKPLPDGDIKDEEFAQRGFEIAGEGERSQMQGFACTGPKGECLVAYVEVRGADDVKVMARVVK